MIIESKYDFDLDLKNTNSLSLMINQIKRGSTVLEFGPANGRMTHYLKEALDCRVYLVEIDEEAGKQAAQYGEDIVIDDAETFSWYEKYENLRFDYITFADVLEHLRDPERLLVKAKSLLKQDGSILLSVPNLAHNSVAISLLNNEFEYTKVGLLDNTHIHFFTKNSLDKAMERCGFVVAKRFATYAPAGTTEIPVDNHSVPGIDASFWKARAYGEVYQYVYEVKKGFEFVTETENYLHAASYPYYCQVFYDYGEGFSEENYKTLQIAVHDAVQQIEFDVPKGVRSVRIDPLNGPCMLELKGCYRKTSEEQVELTAKHHNAAQQAEDRYIFTTEDPNLIFAAEEGTEFEHIIVLLRFVTIDGIKVKAMGEYTQAVHLSVAEYKKNLEEKSERLAKELTEENEQIKRQLFEMKAAQNKNRQTIQEYQLQIGEYAQTVDIMTNSSSWRITSPLRKIGDFFKRI